MSSPENKRYRRYLEPGQSRELPRQTVRYHMVKQSQTVDCCAENVRVASEQHYYANQDRPDRSESPSSNPSGCADSQSLHHETMRTTSFSDQNDIPDTDLPECRKSAPRERPGHQESTQTPQHEEMPTSSVNDASDFFDYEGAHPTDPFHDTDHFAHAGVSDKDMRDYLTKCCEEMLPNQTINKAQAILLILAYVVHAGLSWSQVDGLLKLINTLLGISVVPDSKYLFRKMWQSRMDSVGVHFYCSTCHAYLGLRSGTDTSRSFTCNTCKKTQTSNSLMAKGSFFLIFDLRKQLYDALTASSEALLKSLKKAASVTYGTYSDITDGRIYKSIRQQLSARWHDVTVTMNTDGSPVFKSSRSSVWPIQLLINELPFNVRFQNVLIGALWFAKIHPPAHLFLNAFVKAFNEMGKIQWCHGDETVSSRVFVVSCCVDSPARASVLNMKQFNGYYGCSWCLEEGTTVERTMRYLPRDVPAPLRTHRGVLDDMRAAYVEGAPVHGIKGPSPLLKLPGFNLVWCLPPDYMHCVLEGVTEQITELWMTSVGFPYYIGRQLQELDDRIRNLKPPISFCRLPRPVTDRKHWKATEWLYWLLFYSLPCLRGLIHERYLNHFSLLCQGIFLLLQTSVTSIEIEEADRLLHCFVNRVCGLYGESAATFNVHQLTHLAKSVEMLGPLWGTSTFPFENANGQLVKLITAAQGAPLQIAERCIMKSWLNTASRFVDLTSSLAQKKREILGTRALFQTGVHVLGAPVKFGVVQEAAKQLIFLKYGEVENLAHYARVSIEGTLIHTSQYTRSKKTRSNCVKMKGNIFCVVVDICSFLLDVRKVVLTCQELVVSETEFRNISYMRICKRPPPLRNLRIYAPDDMLTSCVFIDHGSVSYVCELPNNYKID